MDEIIEVNEKIEMTHSQVLVWVSVLLSDLAEAPEVVCICIFVSKRQISHPTTHRASRRVGWEMGEMNENK